MKKVLLMSVSVLALSAGAAFAQTTIPSVAPIAKSPVDNVYGTAVGDQSYVQQIGTGNQIGNDGNSGVTQQITNTGANYAEVYQGWNGGTNTNSDNAKASVTQTPAGGAKNVSRTVQYGTNDAANTSNEAYTTQNTNGTGATSSLEQNGANLKAFVNQTGAGVTSNLSQTGNGGSVNVNQTSTGASSTIVQAGTGNGNTDPAQLFNINVQQSGWASNTSGVNQSGNNNLVSVSQSGSPSLTNNSTVLQTSDTSHATVIQDGTISATGYNTSLVNQIAGAGNIANVTQHGAAGYENYSDVEQQNGANASLTQQASNGSNWSDIQQNGASFATVSQTSTNAANNSTVIQKGDGNHAYVTQK